MIPPVMRTADAAHDQRQRRGGQRAEDGQQDQQDDREADALGAGEVFLGEVDHARPERALADQVHLDLAVVAPVGQAELAPQLLADVGRVELVDAGDERDDHRPAGPVGGEVERGLLGLGQQLDLGRRLCRRASARPARPRSPHGARRAGRRAPRPASSRAGRRRRRAAARPPSVQTRSRGPRSPRPSGGQSRRAPAAPRRRRAPPRPRERPAPVVVHASSS